MIQIAQRFDYSTKKLILEDIIKDFDNFCRLKREVYTPFIKEEDLNNRFVGRNGFVMRTIYGTELYSPLSELISGINKIYENPIEELVKFSEDKFKQDYEDHKKWKQMINDPLTDELTKCTSPRLPFVIRKFPKICNPKAYWLEGINKYDAAEWGKITLKMVDFLLDKTDKCNNLVQFLLKSNRDLKEVSQEFWKKFDAEYQKITKEEYERLKQMYTNQIKNVNETLNKTIEKAQFLHQSSWEEVIDFLVYDRWLSFKDVKDSSNKVMEFQSDDLLCPYNSMVIKAGNKRQGNLKLEKNIIDYINKSLKSNIIDSYERTVGITAPSRYYFSELPAFQATSVSRDISIKLPKIMFFSEDITEDYDWLVLKKDIKTVELDGKLNPELKKDCLNAITEFLAYIHTATPQSISQKGEIKISDHIKAKLDNKFLDLTEDKKTKIYENLTPVLSCLSKTFYVFAKDAHPGNFIVYGNKLADQNYLITAIDWEDKGFRPLHLDLVSLLECSGNLTCEEKKDFIQNYIHFFNVYNHKEEFEKLEYDSNFKLAYSNAVIYYSIILSSVFSSPKMKGCSQKRRNFLEKAVKSINDIKEEHKEYYDKYKENYSLLEDTLKESIPYFS